MDAAWAVAAFGAGLGIAALAILAEGQRRRPAPAPRLTATWRLDELDRPLVACRGLDGLDVPRGAQVLCSGAVDAATLRHVPVHRVQRVPAEFAIDAAGTRALLFVGGLRPGAWALATSEPALLDRLKAEAAALQATATPYAERRRVADLAGEPGLPVETEGTVRDVMPRAGGHLVRLEDDGHVAAVRAVAVEEGLSGRRVVVRGRLGRDASGYPVLDADEIRVLP